MLKASFDLYKKEKEFDGIIIMDSAITKFLYIGSPDDMANSSFLVNSAFPSWTDTQSNAMKVTLAQKVQSSNTKPTKDTSSQTRKIAIQKKISDIGQPQRGIRPTDAPEISNQDSEISEPRQKR